MTDAATTSERHRVRHGRDEPPVERRKLRAGPIDCELEGVDLRYVRAGDVELLRRLYVAVRDRNWATLPIEIHNLEVEDAGDSFRLTFEARHRQQEIDFRWHGELTGGADGSIDYSLRGTAESEFLYNRIGFCILHPAENAGRRYRARTPEGVIAGQLPDTIGPQLWESGFPKPIFPSFDELEIEVADGLVARFELEGDLFETEDQRNWTDASFKTYSTPLQLGYPHQAEPGKRIDQRVRLTLEGSAPAPASAAEAGDAVRIELGDPVGPLPKLGLSQSTHGEKLSARETELLRALRPDHLRVELDLDGDWRGELDRGIETAQALGCELELAVFLGDEPEGALDELAKTLGEAGASVARVLVFRHGEHSTGAAAVSLAREQLGGAVGNAPFAGGSNALFTEVNRTRPDVGAVDGVVFALNATVHAVDDTSVMETPGVHGETVRSARAFSDGLPVHVGPVTFNQRSNPVATGPEPEPGPGELPPPVDARQCSLLGAAWTLASAKSLAEAGTDSVTYFETTGWRGVVETETGSPVPESFPSRPGAVFPLYHVLADLGEGKGAEVLASRSSRPLAVASLALRRGDGLVVLLANLTPTEQRCVVEGLPEGEASVRTLDEETALEAADEPEAFRDASETARVAGGRLEFTLLPYAVVRLQL
jgi:D-apionolactonase